MRLNFKERRLLVSLTIFPALLPVKELEVGVHSAAWAVQLWNNVLEVAEASYSHGKMSTNSEPKVKGGIQTNGEDKATEGSEHDDTLKYQLLGPSLTKAGQDKVDQQKVRAIYPRTSIYH